jgi:geranylgeranyl diphosphate synthase type II
MKKILIQKINSNASLVEAEINRILSGKDEALSRLYESMLYSAQGGGKRIRPFLTLEFCRMLGGDDRAALPLSVAVELVHTYSLIHDDLPCMDNDDFRRGKPSNHKVFGEATALLAGDALLTLAFEVICKADFLSFENRVKAINVLASAAGADGMIGGQQLDLLGENEKLSRELHTKMNLLKTGALIKVAASLGCIAADADDTVSDAAYEYAENLGLAFQVTDDLLDNGQEDEKTTYLSFMSVNKAEEYAEKLTEKAVSAISEFKNNELLKEFAYYLAKRTV